jgi:hypothetical protein
LPKKENLLRVFFLFFAFIKELTTGFEQLIKDGLYLCVLSLGSTGNGVFAGPALLAMENNFFMKELCL